MWTAEDKALNRFANYAWESRIQPCSHVEKFTRLEWLKIRKRKAW